MVGLVDLGMIHEVEVDATSIHVRILPTFVGCPALDLIADAIREGLDGFGRDVDVQATFSVPWTTDRISDTGRAALVRAGIAPAGIDGEVDDVRCPLCSSAQVVMDSAFGPTQCRSLFYCRDCRQPFEAMKRV